VTEGDLWEVIGKEVAMRADAWDLMLYRSWRTHEKVIIQDPTLNLPTDSTLRRPLTDMKRAVTRIRQLFVDREPMQ
jgi:hypothetical protein